MAFQKLQISKNSYEIADKLSKKLGIELASLYRIAMGLSLNRYGTNVKSPEDSKGNQFNRYTLFTINKVDYDLFYRTLFESVYDKKLTEEEFFGENSVVKCHIDAGLKYMWEIFNEVNQDIYEFRVRLLKINKEANKEAKVSSITTTTSRNVHQLNLLVGKDDNGKDIILELNNQNKHGNSHLAIMGNSGLGKTQILLNMLCQIREKSNYETNFIFFDYKGEDSLYKNPFLKVTKATTFIPPEDHIPINPFILDSYSDTKINISAKEKADTFSLSGKGFGEVQKSNLQDIIIACYEDKKGTRKPYPDLNDVYEKALEIYQERNIKSDSLISILRSFGTFGVFANNDEVEEHMSTIYDKTFIVGLNKITAEGLRELAAYLIIEKLYQEMKLLPESEVKDGYRQIRTILVIDEAHNYLSKKNIFLEKIIREGRSKGIIVFFASQSPKDYEQEHYDFKSTLEFSFVLGCNDLSSSSIERLIGCSSSSAQNLKSVIPVLAPYKVIMKSKDSKNGYIMFTGDAFRQKYK